MISAAFIIESDRSFLQDPRFGVLVMSEVAQKAMSAAINDVGSAISGINALTRILIDNQADPNQSQLDYKNISIESFDIKELITTSFAPLARDCLGNIELNQRMLKSLAIIKNNVPEVELQQAAEQTGIQLVERSIQHFEFKPDQLLLTDEFKKNFPEAQKHF